LLKRLKQLSTSIAHANPWWEYRHDRYVRPDETEGEYYYVHTHGSVVVIPVLEDGRLFMTRQYRYLNQRESLEFIGGGVKQGVTSLESAREELLEEGGFEARELVPIGRFNPFNGATDEICEIFVARGLKKVGARPEASEEFEECEFTLEEIEQLIRTGELWDGMSIAALMLYKLNLVQQHVD
jgi:8-oxo-dGTP pyrophosphatase MutT (NUDIX family)